jgi:hypothetical protein
METRISHCCKCKQRCALIITALLFYLPVWTVQCICIPPLVTVYVVHVMNTAKVRIRMIDLCYLSEQAVGLYREKESRYPLSLQQGEVANTNARSDGRSVYTNNSIRRPPAVDGHLRR